MIPYLFLRDRASLACPGTGLALCGVGFDFDDLADYKNASKRDSTSMDGYDGLVSEKRGSTYSDSNRSQIPNPASRRKKNKQSSSDSSSCALVPYSNVSASISGHFRDTIKIDTKWREFRNELTLCDSLLLFYPERCFSFSFGDVVIPQSSVSIFSTIWDAEVVLAHFLDSSSFIEMIKSSESASKDTFTCLELGAGCGLAAIVLVRKFLCSLNSQQTIRVIAQEIDEEAVSYTSHCVTKMKSFSSERAQFSFIPGRWGKQTIDALRKQEIQQVEFLFMADVFYHTDHFADLFVTIEKTICVDGSLVFAFEQRRKDLLPFVQQILELFSFFDIREFPIERKEEDFLDQQQEVKDDNVTASYEHSIFVFSCFNKKR